MRRAEGFTLVEALIVLIIIGILAGFALPAFSSFLDKSRAEVCMANQRTIKSAFVVERLNDRADDNQTVLEHAKKAVMEGRESGCPGKGGDYAFIFRKADGDMTNGTDSDAASVVVVCSANGHGGTTLERAETDIGAWLAGYSGEIIKDNPYKPHELIKDYLNANGGHSYALTPDDYRDIFGDRTGNTETDYDGTKDGILHLYLRPMGVLVNGELQNVQYVTRHDTIAGVENENMRSYAIIVNGKAYIATNKDNQVIGTMRSDSLGAGEMLYTLARREYSSIDEFVAAITAGGCFKEADS